MLLYSKSLILACSQCSLETKPGLSVVDHLSVCYHTCSYLRNRLPPHFHRGTRKTHVLSKSLQDVDYQNGILTFIDNAYPCLLFLQKLFQSDSKDFIQSNLMTKQGLKSTACVQYKVDHRKKNMQTSKTRLHYRENKDCMKILTHFRFSLISLALYTSPSSIS